ncbi:MAG TPA: lytic transglycosylase domain-containing protein [Candidatus Cloacimonadota bacterium]|nr:lytic transglycosylase domain-containing protein [Candidatus Cloacimonadota bacterium]
MAKKGSKKKRKMSWWLKIAIGILILIALVYNPISVRIMSFGVAIVHRLDPVLFYRLIRTESSFRSFAVSPKNAIGLGQIKESTAFYIHGKHRRGLLFVPIYNLNLSAKYVKYLLSRFDGNWSLALAAYNWGETNVSRRVSSISIEPAKDYRMMFSDIPETHNYITKIMGPIKKT